MCNDVYFLLKSIQNWGTVSCPLKIGHQAYILIDIGYFISPSDINAFNISFRYYQNSPSSSTLRLRDAASPGFSWSHSGDLKYINTHFKHFFSLQVPNLLKNENRTCESADLPITPGSLPFHLPPGVAQSQQSLLLVTYFKLLKKKGEQSVVKSWLWLNVVCDNATSSWLYFSYD